MRGCRNLRFDCIQKYASLSEFSSFIFNHQNFTKTFINATFVLRLFDILGGVSSLRNTAFINKTLITLNFKCNETIKKTKRNVSTV